MESSSPRLDKKNLRTFTLLDTVIVFLISCSLVIFVFSIAARFLGQDTFNRLPEYIRNSYAALWSAGVVAGGTLVGAVVDSLSKQTSTKGNFIAWVFLTTLLLMALIGGVIGLSKTLDRPLFTVPYGATPLDIANGNVENSTFHMQNPFGYPRARLQGTYSIRNYILTGRLSDSELIPAPSMPGFNPTPLFDSIAVHVCYLAAENGMPVLKFRPALPGPQNSETLNVHWNNSAPVAIPNFKFVINVHHIISIAPPYLCAILSGSSSVMPLTAY